MSHSQIVIVPHLRHCDVDVQPQNETKIFPNVIYVIYHGYKDVINNDLMLIPTYCLDNIDSIETKLSNFMDLIN